MAHLVSDLKQSVKRSLSGLQVDQLDDLDGSLEKAARTVVLMADMPEAVARETVSLYDGVYDYPVSASLFGTAAIDVRPQGNSRDFLDNPSKVFPQYFDRHKKQFVNSHIAIEYDKGTPIARITSPKPKSKVRLDTMQDTTGWTAASTAGSLAEDSSDFFESPSSLRLTLTGSGAGTLTKAISSADLTDYEDLGVVFLAIKTPSVASLTSISLKLGSSASSYDSVTATAGFIGAWTASRWLLVAFDMSTSTTTGGLSLDWSAIDYAQLTINHTATITNFRVGDLFISRPFPHDLIYASAAIWKPSGSNPSQTIVNDSDEILLSDAPYLLLEDQAALTIAEELGGDSISTKISSLRAKLYGSGNDPGEYRRYRAQNPSRRLSERRSYGGASERLSRRFSRRAL